MQAVYNNSCGGWQCTGFYILFKCFCINAVHVLLQRSS